MSRFIMIDRQSGFVWGEAEAETPADACRAMDSKIAEPAADYIEHGPRSAERYNTGNGYFVHVAPADFPEVDDGQDPEQIRAVEALPCVAIVEAKGERYAEHFAEP